MTGPLTLALHVLILAGGGRAEENHHSHLVHVQTLDQLLLDRGIAPENIALFWADGQTPGPDRGVIDALPIKGSWLIEGTALDEPTAPAPELENTVFPGRVVHAAKRASLQRWLTDIGPKLGPEDTLFIAVTDHGEPDPTGGRETAITLWGERWTVSQMEADLKPVPESTRVVLMLSQCHSGGFADLAKRRKNLCGSFSTHADRLSYGCYPHLAVQADIGHFMHVTRALRHQPAIGPATDRAMMTDDSPDVPHLTSDAFLFDAITEEMERRGGDIQSYVDGHLREDGHEEWTLLATIAARYGLGMLQGYGGALALWEEASIALDAAFTWNDRWNRLHTQARDWVARPLADALRKRRKTRPVAKGAAARHQLRGDRLTAIDDYRRALGKAPRTARRVQALSNHAGRGVALQTQLEQQEAALVRAMYLLGRRAGPRALSSSVRTQYEALQACESKPLLPSNRASAMVTESKPLSPLTANMAAVETLRPGFLGIGYRDDADGKRVVVDSIVPGGPALTTSLRVGDKITSVGDWTLRHPSEFRSSAALAVPGSVISLNVERAAEKKLIRLSVAGAPLPPRPPSFGGMVPSLRLTPYPGTEALPVHGMGQPIVLFFWATHCAPCKAAIPALTQWARSRGVEVIAITGEDREAVKTYLSKRKSPFPFPIGLDTYGEAARLFIIDQSPVFVVIDPSGRFTEEHRGFLKTLPLRWPQRTERP